MGAHTVIVWFRNDLRLADHPALHRAVATADAVVPVFIWAPEEEGDWPPGAAQRWWLHHSLAALDDDLRAKGSRLILRIGPSRETLAELVASTGAAAVFWNQRFEPSAAERDRRVAEALRQDGVAVETFASCLLHDPERVQTSSGGPYRVYTPFWRKLEAELEVGEPLAVPRMGETRAPSVWPDPRPLADLDLLPRVDWAKGIREQWKPGEQAGAERLERFVHERLIDYAEHRDRPDLAGTSELSPHLRHGELSPRQVWSAVQGWVRNAAMKRAADAFLREIAWREFSYHLLHHYPATVSAPLHQKFEEFPWREDRTALERWQRGRTGYPIVDAGMRQLWATGWMHNRVRMIVASFLTKDLLITWREGARWFWDTLVDGDLANNTMGWQWSAGSGADAQPFFRIFNPVTQGERYDRGGDYVRRWVPELKKLPDRYLHRPWEAPDEVRAKAGIEREEDYPGPLVDHRKARRRALAAYDEISEHA